MQLKKIKIHDKKSILNFGKISFYIGVFFLASALPITLICLICSISSSIYAYKFSLFKDKWTYILCISALLMIISTTNGYFIGLNTSIDTNKSEIWFKLFNWIPLFFLFSTIKIYLKSKNDRILFSKFLLAGSLPVIISCIFQKWFRWYGPHETFYGLIIWFNKKLYEGDGISGLFSNQNYTGFWLSTIFPLSLGILLYKKRPMRQNFLIIAFILFTFYLTFLTYSRNAIIGLFPSLTIILGVKIFVQLLIIFLIFIMLIYFLSIFYPPIFLSFFESFLPINIISKFMNFNFSNFEKWTRFEIWAASIKLIARRPLLGYGATSFSLFYFSKYNFGHTHNIPLQLAFDYGLPLSLLLCGFVITLLIKSWTKIMNSYSHKISSREIIFDKCWLLASIVAVLSHMNDITYYDGKISILIWILFAGLVCINNEKTSIN